MSDIQYSVFSGFRKIASGDLRTALAEAKAFYDSNPDAFLIFDHATGRQVDFNFNGSLEEVLARVLPKTEGESAASSGAAKPGKGRPRLGVVPGEVTLLPRHWEWLAKQPLRASGTLRRLVDEARAKEAVDPKKKIEALGTLLWSLAGNLPDFEEASRALYAGDLERFLSFSDRWPEDLGPFCREWTATASPQPAS